MQSGIYFGIEIGLFSNKHETRVTRNAQRKYSARPPLPSILLLKYRVRNHRFLLFVFDMKVLHTTRFEFKQVALQRA